MDKAQELADKFTNEVMAERFGKRFTEIEDLEDDDEMNKVWEYLNEKFYELVVPIL